VKNVSVLSKSNLCRVAGSIFSGALILFCVGGCGYTGYPLTGGTSAPGYLYLTGNWQMQNTSTTGTSPFSAMAGDINEQNDGATTHTVTSVFQVTPTGACFLGAETVPSQGSLTGTALGLNGFSVNGQYVTFSATKDATATHLTGTYIVRGGCAGGAAGTFSGTKLANLTGTYRGSTSATGTMSFALSQSSVPNGLGYFSESGTANFSGFSCLMSATVNSSVSSVIGETVKLVMTDNNRNPVVLNGTFAEDASAITVTSIESAASPCVATTTPFTLTR